MTDRPKSASLLLEIFVIVVSILLAFSIDAMWEDRQESKTRSELIELLIVDFDVTALRLGEAIAAHQTHIDQNKRFLEIISSGEPIERDEFGELAYSFVTVEFFKPALSTYEAAVGSDGLASIHSPVLSESIAEFYQNLEAFDYHMQVFKDIYYLGSINDIRKQVGSWGVLLRGETDCIGRSCIFPKELDMSVAELRKFVVRPDVYAGFESSRIAQINLFESLRAMDAATSKILAELKSMRKRQ